MDNTLSFLNLTGIINRPTYTKPERLNLGSEQERQFAKLLSEQGNIYAKRIKDVYPNLDNEYDLKNGDVGIFINDKINTYYDLKVAEFGQKLNYYGVITVNSIFYFICDDKHFYVCTNADGSDYCVIPAKSVKKYFHDTPKCLYTTINPERNKHIITGFPNKDIEQNILSKYISNKYGNISTLDYIISRDYPKLAINKSILTI